MAQYRFPKNTTEHQNWTRISIHDRVNEFKPEIGVQSVDEALHQI